MKFTLQRHHEGRLIHEMSDLDLETTKGIVMLCWGVVPDSLVHGGEPSEDWKLGFGEGHWLVVTRTD